MTEALQATLRLLEVVALFVPCFIGPGFLVVRRLPWSAAEKLAASFVLSVLLIGLATFGIFALNMHDRSYGAVAGLGIFAFIAGWKDLRALWDDAEGRELITAYVCLAGWMFGLVCLIRAFSGGGWGGDWIEQYDRVRFFLHKQPMDTLFRGEPLPSRPPLMNLACVPIMMIAAPGFPQYQALTMLFGVGAVFPAYLVAKLVAGSRRIRIAVLVAVLAFNPFVVETVTYPWSKMLSALCVATGAAFYVKGWRAADSWRMRMAVVAFTTGVLVHYSAAPYAIFVAIHFVINGCLKFTNRAVELAVAAIPAFGLLGGWVWWASNAYGYKVAFGSSDTAVHFGQRTIGENLALAVQNILVTIVPHEVRFLDTTPFEDPIPWSHARESAFLTYQTNALFMFGVAGAIALVYLFLKRRNSVDLELRWFWGLFFTSGLVLGAGAHAYPDTFGLAHLALQPMVLVGLGVVIGTWDSWPPLVNLAFIGGLLVDLFFGIVLHIAFEGRTFGEGLAGDDGLFPGGLRAVPDAAAANWDEKLGRHFMFFGDAYSPLKWVVVAALILGAWSLLRRLLLAAQGTPDAPAARAVAGA